MTAPATDLVPPPPRWWWGFRVLGLRVPEQHRAWVAHHLRSDRAVRRTVLLRLAVFWAYTLALAAIAVATDSVAALGGLAGTIVVSLSGAWFGTTRNRRGMLRWQRVEADGRPVEPRGTARLGNVPAVGLTVALAAAGLLVYRAILLAAP